MLVRRTARPSHNVAATGTGNSNADRPAHSITTHAAMPHTPTANCASVNVHGSVRPGRRPISLGRRRDEV